jgi:hypothetical protein
MVHFTLHDKRIEDNPWYLPFELLRSALDTERFDQLEGAVP